MLFPPSTKSPKRKRDDADSAYGSSSIPSSSRQPVFNLQDNHILDEDRGRNSPRSVVAGCLGDLDIYGDASRPESKHQTIATDGKPLPSRIRDQSAVIKSSGGAESIASGSPPPDTHREEEIIPHPPAQKKGRTSTSPASSPKRSPKAKHSSALQPEPRRRSKSPPLSSSSDENPLTWSDSEITGHLGNDPNDDGYGINGLGFKPTAAMARSRSERRKKQIAEWKTREAREARQSRRERRDGVGGESNESNQETKNQSYKKVKFDA